MASDRPFKRASERACLHRQCGSTGSEYYQRAHAVGANKACVLLSAHSLIHSFIQHACLLASTTTVYYSTGLHFPFCIRAPQQHQYTTTYYTSTGVSVYLRKIRAP